MAGDAWTLGMEWNDRAGSGWQPGDVRKSAAYTLRAGLVITLDADDNVPAARDLEHNDLVVSCTSLDPEG